VDQEQLRQRDAAVLALVKSGSAALERGDVESALAAARQARALDVRSPRAQELEAQALSRLDIDPAETVIRPPRASSSPKSAPIGSASPAPKAIGAPLSTPVPKVTPAAPLRAVPLWPQLARKNWVYIAGTVGLVVGGWLVVSFLGRGQPAIAPGAAGTVAFDAVPWGTVTAIRAADGTSLALPEPSSTPLSVSLPPGSYRVLVQGPQPELPAQEIQIVVESGKDVVAEPVRFAPLTAEEYFEHLLTVASGGAPDDGSEAGARRGGR
jgi:hypothetical protein